MKPLAIVVPARDEAEALPALLASFRRLRLPRGSERILVDDGSRDRGGELARRAGWRVLRTEGLGYGGALKAGFKAAKAEWLAFLDADGTYPPGVLLDLWRQRAGVDMLLADRLQAGHGMPRLRVLGNTLFSMLASWRTGVDVKDLCTGQRLFHRRLLARVEGLPDGLDFSPAFTLAALRAGASLRWLPAPYLERTGGSKLGIVRDGLRFLKVTLTG